jgi:DNA-binding transcriptional ArsR family regulator
VPVAETPSTRIFRALADPTRRAVFERLAAGEATVTELKAGFDVTQPAISQHLAVLRDAGLVSDRREGRQAFYRAEPRGLDPLVHWLVTYRVFWTDSLGKLGDVLKELPE